MKAITYSAFGAAPDVLKLTERESTAPGPGEVKVDLRFSGVNPSDVKARAGARAGVTEPPYPVIIPHSDGSGLISEVGEGVDPARVGQRVWIWNGQWRRAFGTAAQSCTLPSGQAVRLPDRVSFETGATLGIPGLTATHAVFGHGDVSGQTILVQGGAGTVGFLAVQLAKWGGARVIATASPSGFDRVRAAGADFVLDYSAPDQAKTVLDAAGGPVDRIIEPEFGSNIEIDAEVIAENGTIVGYGSAKVINPVLPYFQLMFKAITLELILVYILTAGERAEAIRVLSRALEENALDTPVDRIFPLDQCAAAHNAVFEGGRSGAVLVDVQA